MEGVKLMTPQFHPESNRTWPESSGYKLPICVLLSLPHHQVNPWNLTVHTPLYKIGIEWRLHHLNQKDEIFNLTLSFQHSRHFYFWAFIFKPLVLWHVWSTWIISIWRYSFLPPYYSFYELPLHHWYYLWHFLVHHPYKIKENNFNQSAFRSTHNFKLWSLIKLIMFKTHIFYLVPMANFIILIMIFFHQNSISSPYENIPT